MRKEYSEWRTNLGITTRGKEHSKEDVLTMVKEMKIGLPDGTVLCDLCNKEIFDQDDIRLSIGFLDISRFEHDKLLKKLSRLFDRVFISSGPGEPETYLCCTKCIPTSIRVATIGTDEWIVKGHIISREKFPRIAGAEILDHSPPDTGS